MRKGWTAWVVGVTVSLALSGCSGDGGGGPVPGEGARESVSVGPAPADVATVAPVDDHPVDAARAALRRLDACALIDRSVTASTGMADKLWQLPDSPHSCTVTDKPLIGSRISVQAGYSLSRAQRYRAEPITAGRAKAYLDRAELPSRCRVDLPVGRTLSIRFTYELAHGTTGDACGSVKAFAEAGAGLLAGGGPAEGDPGKRPLVDREACTVMRGALAADAERFTIAENGIYALDSCTATPKDTKVLRRGIDLEVKYTTDPMGGTNVVTRAVGTRQARVTTYSGACKLEWSQGASGLGGTLNGFTVVALKAESCDAAADLAARIVPLLDGAATPDGQEPARRLLYAPEESDSSAVGACVDFLADDSFPCTPYDSLPVPATIQGVLDGADDPRMGCALAADAVREVLGDAYRAVLWGQSCFFVEPTHTSVLRVDVDARAMARAYGGDSKSSADRREVDVAGKPAVTFRTGGGNGKPATGYSVYVALAGDVNTPGIVAGRLEALPARGLGTGAVPDTTGLPRLDQVMTKLVASRLPR
ncbi:hypothetical protein [Embleya hyalina]|uniref:Lipoprotein n=1 Tax=Embleya hyalina TaxID=516124 RepID=A0A401YQN7_9ACTN|nr:hypothetical protein [Embleya hyalina]GCD96910.1 hypothetical protein EHYA_04597 [Embleya hyalina]